MSPHQVTEDLIQTYGEPKVLNILFTPFVNFASGRSRVTLAKKFALAGCLKNKQAEEYYAKHANQDTPEFWNKVGEMEGLPAIVNMVPEIINLMNTGRRQSRISEFSWDQASYDRCRFALQCIKDTGLSATSYPLFEGAPGASKTQIAVTVATLVQRPVYPVVGGDGAADEIKAALLGGPYPSDKAAWAIAKENAYVGGLSSPFSERYLIELLEQKPFEAITVEEFTKLAELEGIREGITYDKKGAYQLAKENGGILLLEECNSFPAEVHSLLTQILENYVNGSTHPNFFIIATQNEAGDSHPSRNPLPKEVVNRLERYRVEPPTKEQYIQSLHYTLFKEQPTINLLPNKKGSVTPAMLGVDLQPSKPHALVQILTRASAEKFSENFCSFHKAIEQRIEDGILDPKEAQDPPTKETTFISRRNIRRFLNALENAIHSFMEAPSDQFEEVSLSTYLSKVPKDIREFPISNSALASVIWSTLERYYIQPNVFPIHQKVEIMDKQGNKQQKLVTNTKDILHKLAADNFLNTEALKKYIHTTVHNEKLETAFLERFRKAADIASVKHDHEKKILEFFKNLTQYQQEQAQPLVDGDQLTIVWPQTEDPFSDIEEICPMLKEDDNRIDTCQNIAEILDRRRKTIQKKNMSYLSTDEIMGLKTWVQTLRTEKQLYFIPAFHGKTDTRFCLIASIHRDHFPPINDKGQPVEPTNPDAKANLKKLLKAYPPEKPFANLNIVLMPRDAKDAVMVPPLSQLRSGTQSASIGAEVKLGENAKPNAGLLELVKWIP